MNPNSAIAGASPGALVAYEFLKHFLRDGPWHLTAIHPDTRAVHSSSFLPGQERQLIAWIEERSGHFNLYFAVNKVRAGVSKKAKKSDVEEVVALHVDIDPIPERDLEAERARILSALRGHVPPPSLIVDSGGGYQGFWLLRNPVKVAMT